MHFASRKVLVVWVESGLRVNWGGGLRSPRDSRGQRGALSAEITPDALSVPWVSWSGPPLCLGYCVESRS